MLSVQGDHRRGWRKVWAWLFISSRRTPCSIGSGAQCMSPPAASQRRKLVEMYPNIQCSVRIYTVYIYYFYSLYSAYESVKHSGICVGGTFCMEIWGTCSLFCFSTSEVLSCSGMPSMTPQQVHCWLWCWTWHPSGTGPLFGKSTGSHLTCVTRTWFEKKKTHLWCHLDGFVFL